MNQCLCICMRYGLRLVVLFQRHTSTKSSVGGAIPRVTVKEEKTILEETSQIKTSLPVCSHNEWDPLEVMVGERREGY